MKWYLWLPLTARTKTSNRDGWIEYAVVPDSARLIDRKYPELDYLEMHRPDPPPEIAIEREAIRLRMLEIAKLYIASDGRMGNKPWHVADTLCIEIDLDTGDAVLLQHRTKTTETGWEYVEWYNPKTEEVADI